MSHWRRRELKEELETHLRMAIADRVARGQSEQAARTEALREFGNMPLLQDVTSSMWRWAWWDRLVQDIRYALRQMQRAPGFAISVAGTMALGIGAAVAMFTVVDHVLLEPVAYHRPDSLVQIEETDDKGGTEQAPWLDIEGWKRENHVLEDIAFSTPGEGRPYLEGKDAGWEVSLQRVSPNLFQVLGAKPKLGRGFIPETPGFAPGKNAATVVLSDAIWREAFAADPNILGHVVKINGQSYSVAGVMDRNFLYPADDVRHAQAWTSIVLSDSDRSRDDNRGRYNVIGRLRAGVTVAKAQAELTVLQKPMAAQYTDAFSRALHSAVKVRRYSTTLVAAAQRKALLALLAASGVLWLIAAVNATNLLLARSTARQREIAIRGALGASRWRIVQQLVVENLLLSGAAGLLGTALALGSIRLLSHELQQQLPLPAPATAGWLVMLTVAALTFLTGLLSILWPVMAAMRAPVEPELRQGNLQASATRPQHRLRAALIVVEVALSLTLLVACGLLLRTIFVLRQVPLGYRTDHIVVASLDIPAYRFTGRDIVRTLYGPLLEHVRRLPGVEAAGLMSEVPMGRNFRVQLDLRLNGNVVHARLKLLSPEVGRIFGLGMMAGRFFDQQDSPTSQPVMLVNPAFAREFAPDKHDPKSLLGTHIWSLRKDAPFTVAGILDRTLQDSPSSPSQPEIDVCFCQVTPDAGIYGPSTFAVDLALRSPRPMDALIPELRSVLQQASPELTHAPIATMNQIVEDSYGSQRLAVHLLEIFGGAALLLCIAGLYGLLAYVVTQRTREIGVRIALGASRGSLLGMVLRQATVMLLAGVLAGSLLAWFFARLLTDFLYGVQAHDGKIMAAAATILFVSGLASAWFPAWRAAHINPVEALRAE